MASFLEERIHELRDEGLGARGGFRKASIEPHLSVEIDAVRFELVGAAHAGVSAGNAEVEIAEVAEGVLQQDGGGEIDGDGLGVVGLLEAAGAGAEFVQTELSVGVRHPSAGDFKLTRHI